MISVVTPVYNGERFIESCIQVVINQQCFDVEHIIVDGGSTDQTVTFLKEYAEKYPHIRWISEKDKGQSDAMNKGIALAKGNIIGILNVDDYYEPKVLNRILKIFQELPEPSLLVGNCNVWDDNDDLVFVNKPKKLKITDLLIANANLFPINPSSYFYHASLHQKIGFYKVDEHYAMDLDFILRTVQVATVRYIDETWGNFRLIEGSKTVNDEKYGRGFLRKESIFRSYRKQLPLIQQWYVSIVYQLHEIKKYAKKIYQSEMMCEKESRLKI
jgi:glycosyltransferase involved in cell wall biosynthesis